MRTRTWVLATGPVLLAIATPWILIWAYAGRLPERAYVFGWSRLGPDFAHLAPAWSKWASGYLFLALYGGLLVTGLVRLRHWPPVQRLVIAATWVVAGQIISEAVLGIATLPGPTPWWTGPVSVGAGVLSGGVAWLLVGSLPSVPEASGALPDGVPMRHLRAAERVVFSQPVWSAKALALGCVLVLGAPIAFALNARTLPATLTVLGVALILQSKARIQVDSEGLLVDLPLLRTRRRVPYREVKYADAVEHAPAHGWWPLLENTRRSGYVAHSGPATVLHLSDERTFVVSAPATAAALVNGELARQRVES